MINLHTQIKEIEDRIGGTITPAGGLCGFLMPQGQFLTTKDGLTALLNLKPKDPLTDFVLKLICNASEATVAGPGDGTSSTVVMIEKMYRLLKPRVQEPHFLKGFQDCVLATADNLQDSIYKLELNKENLYNLAMTSSNQDEGIATLVQEAYSQTEGKAVPVVRVSTEEGLTATQGYTVLAGYLTNAFINDERRQLSDCENPYVIACDKIDKLDHANLLACMKQAVQDQRPLVIYTTKVHDVAFKDLVANALIKIQYPNGKEMQGPQGPVVHNGLLSCIIELKHGGRRLNEIIQDIRAKTGAKELRNPSFPESPDEMGGAERVITDKEKSILFKGDTEEFLNYLEGLKNETPAQHEQNWYQERIDRLSSIIVEIGIGGDSALEREERRHRLEDTVLSYGSALEFGLVPGFGIAYPLHAPLRKGGSDVCTKAYMEGWNEGLQALTAVMERCIANCKVQTTADHLVIDKKIYDITLDTLVDIRNTTVVDSAEVITRVLRSALSIVVQLAKLNYVEIDPSLEKANENL